jgi:hypothetical protein
MSQISSGRRRGNAKAVSAALGVGVLITMGALTFSHRAGAVDPSSESWTADTSVTFIPVTRTQTSSTPQYIVNPCDWATWHVQVHHDYC